MPLDTNLNVFPYYDDFNEANEFYAVGFKPKVSVQARELNQLQTILRHQIEKFGDAIFDTGTIIDGCNFVFYPSYPYVKIKDLTTDNFNVTPTNYVGLFVKNNSNLQAMVVDYAQGFETTDPDLNTLYLSYRNSGSNSNTFQYSVGDVLTIFDSNTSIWKVAINNAGVGFSNGDTVVFTSALAVNVSSGSFNTGDFVTQPSTGANLQITGIDLTSLASVGQVLLNLKPRTSDLSSATSNGSQWAVANNDTIRNAVNSAVGTVMSVYGTGATGAPLTDGSGRILSITMTSRGLNYGFLPTVTVKSANNNSGVAVANLVAQNFLTKITVANTVGAVGNGYAFGVSEGTIYQKGLFLKVDAQTIVVQKYTQLPNNVSVGFRSNEQIITSDIDTSLLDNAAGFPNYQAPGADRIKLVPTLVLANTTDPNFLPIVSWTEGNPFRQNQQTEYSAIGDKMALTEYETNGNFVLNRFQVTARSPFTRAFEGTKVSIITNPGAAYIMGKRVFNNTNYSTDIFKTTDTSVSAGRYITLNYGNWVRVKETGGVFQYSTGDTVTFYDTAKLFLSNTTSGVAVGNLTPSGTSLGTARIRSMVHEFGIPGDPGCTYKMYLFDIVMNAGANFSSIRSIGYAGTFNGIADVVLTNSSSQGNIAVLANTDFDYLLFDSGALTLKNATNVNYTYRTIDQTLSFANTGLLTKSIASTPSETFPYVGSLTSNQLQDLYVVPVATALIASANAVGTANALTTSNVITGNASTWLNDFAPGDFIQLFQNSTVSSVRRVVSVANNINITMDANSSFSGSNLGVYRYFPVGGPIPLGLRTGLTANVSANQQVLTVNLGMALQGAVTQNTAVGVNILRTNVSAATKTAARDQFVKICTSNNAGSVGGPWAIGVSDIFRLKRVFMDTANTVSNTSPEVTSYFYIDHKQNEDWVDLGYLYLRPSSGLTIANGAFLLCQFDCFQSSGSGFFDTVSYTGANASVIATTDSTPLANLGASISTWEIPECIGSRGQYFDLNKFFDFRPIAANSVTVSANSQLAPLNPVYSLSFGNTANPANDKKFPLPDSAMQYDMEQYMLRIDGCFADKDGKISVVRGLPSATSPRAPRGPKNAIRLVNIYLPQYPCLPATTSDMQNEILTTRIGNINYLARRQAGQTITIPSAPGTPHDSQPRGYSMAAVGGLERRIQALEYYTSLSALQTDMANRVVPSSANGAINRFKFGYFVDGFTSAISQDITNPSYAAQICNTRLTPPTIEWTVGYGAAKAAMTSYIDFQIVSQPDASVPIPVPVVVVTPNTTPNTANTVPPVIVVDPGPVKTSTNIWLLRTDHLAPSGSGGVNLNDYAYPVFSSVAGTATLYFAFPVTTSTFLAPPGLSTFAGPTGEPDNVFIYQGSTLIGDAYNNAVPLSGADIAYLQSAAVPGNWFGATSFLPLGRPSAGWVQGAGKISFNHNPAAGQQYTVVGARQSVYDHWIYGMNYPSQFGADIVVPPSASVSTYSGHMDVQPATMLLALTTPQSGVQAVGSYAYSAADTNFVKAQGTTGIVELLTADASANYTTIGVAFATASGIAQLAQNFPVQAASGFQPQSFGITCYGLKPSTNHSVTVNGINKNARCAPPGGGLGAALTTDVYGILKFNYFFDGNSADQDIKNQFVGPYSGEVNWATQVAASMAQPIQSGSLSMVVSAPGSSASFTLTVVLDADLVLQTVAGASQAQLWAVQNSFYGPMGQPFMDPGAGAGG